MRTKRLGYHLEDHFSLDMASEPTTAHPGPPPTTIAAGVGALLVESGAEGERLREKLVEADHIHRLLEEQIKDVERDRDAHKERAQYHEASWEAVCKERDEYKVRVGDMRQQVTGTTRRAEALDDRIRVLEGKLKEARKKARRRP